MPGIASVKGRNIFLLGWPLLVLVGLLAPGCGRDEPAENVQTFDAAPAPDVRAARIEPDGPASRADAAAAIDAPARLDALVVSDAVNGTNTPDARAGSSQTDVRPTDGPAPQGVPDGSLACKHWEGGEREYTGAIPSRCPGRGPDGGLTYAAYTCVDFCACWFFDKSGKPHCSAWKGSPTKPSTIPVFLTFGECLAGCEAIKAQTALKKDDFAFKAYRADNNDFHCGEAAPNGLCK